MGALTHVSRGIFRKLSVKTSTKETGDSLPTLVEKPHTRHLAARPDLAMII